MSNEFDQFEDLSWEEIDKLYPIKQGMARIKDKDEIDIDLDNEEVPKAKYTIKKPEGYKKKRVPTGRQMCNKVDAALSRGDYMNIDSFRTSRNAVINGRSGGLSSALKTSSRWKSFN